MSWIGGYKGPAKKESELREEKRMKLKELFEPNIGKNYENKFRLLGEVLYTATSA